MRSKREFIIFLLSVLCLPAPFVFMKIGPGGYAFYGADVPDIYILGGFILGKDISWWGISFAWKFQLICLLVFTGISLMMWRRTYTSGVSSSLNAVRILLLLLFPLWVSLYSNGVKSNSDGADLTVYPHIGWILYGLILLLTAGAPLLAAMRRYAGKPR
jgi:fumarate reductase subunit D